MKKLLNSCLVAILFLMTAALVPGPASAEKTVGVILTGVIPYYQDIHSTFEQELKGLGMGDVKVLVQKPAPNAMAWTNAARKVVAFGVDAIVVYGGPSTLAVSKETSKVPIVFAGVYDPEALGIKGKNTTGISSKVPLAGVLKNLQSIKQFAKLGVIFNSAEKDTVAQVKEIIRLEGQFNFKTVQFDVKNSADIQKVKDVDALFVSTSCTAHQCVSGIVDAARALKAPTATPISGGEDIGIILTIFPTPQEQGKTAAELVSKVLKGEDPSGMPVVAPKKIEMVINLKEANTMGLKVPFDVLTAASKVVK
jgi:putative ABC transport system substrate-binding protein